MLSTNFNKALLDSFAKNWKWFLFWGILLVILGMIAISVSPFSTLVTVVFLGFLLTMGGIILAVDSFHYWRRDRGAFFVHLITALIYLAIGLMFIFKPVITAISITLLLGISFIVIGVLRMIYAFSSKKIPGRGFRIFNGIVNILLGIFIILEWPMSGLFIIGLFIGIDLLMAGWVYIIAALNARKLKSRQAH